MASLFSKVSRGLRYSSTATPQIRKMGVTKTTHQEGTGPQPQVGQTVTIEYTGFLKDSSKPDNKGKQYVQAAFQGFAEIESSSLEADIPFSTLQVRQLCWPW